MDGVAGEGLTDSEGHLGVGGCGGRLEFPPRCI